MVRNIIHNPVFRIFTPIFYGVTMYILILLIFDTIEKLSANFFSFEVFLCVFLTYVTFETSRFLTVIFEKKCPAECNVNKRIFLQTGSSAVLSLVITSLVISFYFRKLVGFSSYNDWLIVFDVIFVLTSVLYNMIYFSFFYLNRINVSQLDHERILRENVEIELNTYKNKINPEFLYDSLESLILLSKKATEESDQFIQKLSDVYRNILSTKNSEINSLLDEIGTAENLLDILNYRFDRNIRLKIEGKIKENKFQIIKGTLIVIIEDIVNRSIISGIQPLEIFAEVTHREFIISHKKQNKLNQIFSKHMELKHLQNAYGQFERKLLIEENDELRRYMVPVFIKEN